MTLTYNPLHLPMGNTISKSELQRYFKRLRKLTSKHIRYFAVGEYGDKYGRAHYHFIGFGLGLDDEAAIRSAWVKYYRGIGEARGFVARIPMGIVDVGPLKPGGASYLAGYVVKKMTTGERFHLFPWKQPEFALMSKYPPIGSGYAAKIAQLLEDVPGIKLKDEDWQEGKIPNVIHHRGMYLPIDATMKRKIMEYLWIAPPSYGKKIARELIADYQHITRLSTEGIEGYHKELSDLDARANRTERRRYKRSKL